MNEEDKKKLKELGYWAAKVVIAAFMAWLTAYLAAKNIHIDPPTIPLKVQVVEKLK